MNGVDLILLVGIAAVAYYVFVRLIAADETIDRVLGEGEHDGNHGGPRGVCLDPPAEGHSPSPRFVYDQERKLYLIGKGIEVDLDELAEEPEPGR